jgi:pyrimidine operon attenuation protein/uracil phosphoribosyltransferase
MAEQPKGGQLTATMDSSVRLAKEIRAGRSTRLSGGRILLLNVAVKGNVIELHPVYNQSKYNEFPPPLRAYFKVAADKFLKGVPFLPCLFSPFLLVSAPMDFVEKARIMDGARINRALSRLASEIVEENHGADDLYLVGIRRRGVPLAERMADKIADLEGARPLVGILDITLYRDDLSTVGANPVVNRTELHDDIDNRNIVLIDDVLYTGRTIRAALDQLIDFGRPRRVQLAVLIDRGKEHRELPIQADFIGKVVPTKKSEIIKVMLTDFDEEEGVAIVERPATETS